MFGIAHMGLVSVGLQSFVRAFPMAGIAFVDITGLARPTRCRSIRASAGGWARAR
jgi:hypothetical protein